MSNRLFLSDRKMELSSGKLAKFADGSAVVQVRKKKEVKIYATLKFLNLKSLLGHQSLLKGNSLKWQFYF